MPTYEYACQDCDERLEVVQSFSDDPLTTCGSCGGTLRKVFSAAGIIFKGSGYYVTDSRNKKSAVSPPGGSSPAAPDSGGSSKNDSAAAKTPPKSGKSENKTDSATAKSESA